jgi:hypothetical protein
MKGNILKLKPNSIFDIIDSEFFFELNTKHDEYLKSGIYYEYYYAISKYYNPKSILEIGVRYGYSMGCLIKGSDKIESVTGIDCDSYEKDSLLIAEKNIKKYIKDNIDFEFINKDSHSIEKLDKKFDLIHVDGDHSYQGKIQDLNLIKEACNVAIIDDYGGGLPDVRRATDHWIKQNSTLIKNHFVLDSIRGTLILEFL